MRKRTAAVRGDDERVFDPDTALLGKVHTGLDRDDVTGGERSSGRERDPRVLMDLEPDAVPGSVREGIGPAGGADDLATGLVDFDAGYSGAHLLDAGALCGGHDVEHALLRGRRRAR